MVDIPPEPRPTGEFFQVLRLQPQLGRLLSADDNRDLGGHPVAVISDAFWRRRFNAAADAIGRELDLNGACFTIVGVAPAGFTGAWLESPVDVWAPVMMQADVRYTQSFSASNADFLKPWVPQDGLRWLELLLRADRDDGPEFAALNAVFRPALLREADQIADRDQRRLTLDRHLVIEPFAQGSSTLRDRFRAPLVSELLVRMTLGVDSGPLPFSVGVDRRVLGFTVGITLVTSFLFGFAPAWRATDLSLSGALKSSARGTHSGARLSLSKLLVVSQVALSLVLGVGAGLFARSFGNLVALPLGFEPHVIWASISPSIGGYTERELPALYQRIIERAEALPGVESATIAMCGLMTGCRSSADGLAISGYASQPGEQVVVQENRVGPRYFSTVGMTLAAGRDFDARDIGSNASIAIVNEAMARKYFPGRDPIGQRFGYDTPDTEIVGVVRDARVNSVRESAVPMAFYPFDSTPPYAGTLHVRASGDPDTTAAALRRALQEAEPRLPVDRPRPIAELAAGTLRQDRLIARLTTVLGLLALGLACLGLYGLMSYAVKQRTAELGIRFALGAPRPRVLWMVFRESLLLTLAGLAIGVPLVAAASLLVRSLLFDVAATDPAIIAAAMLVLLAVGATSGYLPAWRASRVDPLTALRED